MDSSQLICQSTKVLGNGRIDNLHDIVVVDSQRFERSRSQEVARAVAHFNATLSAENRPYLLIGVGRWGSNDPWLGIPVEWDEISGARAIVEAGFHDFRVTPSQGSHFFQNLTAFQIGYFTVNPDAGEGAIDWPSSFGRAGRRRRTGLRPPLAILPAAAHRDEQQDQPGSDLQAGSNLRRARILPQTGG